MIYESNQAAFQAKLKEVSEHLLHQDMSLAFRKMVDCILDTEDMNFYKQCIELVEWEESNPAKDMIIVKYQWMIDKLGQCKIREKKLSNVLIRTKNIFKTYNKGKFTLGKISLEIKKGEVWGLVGENGNGKTTLLRILAKDLNFDGGELEYLHVAKSSLYDLRTHITYLPQRTPKWYGSLMNNLQFAAANYGTKGDENLLTVQMYIIRFGLWKYRHHQWDELSSGYKMRFELARTFLRKPTLLLLDEPLANLDILSQQLILEDLKNMSQSIAHPMGIVLSSQQLYEVEKVSDHVLFLKNGAPTLLTTINESIQDTIIELEAEVSKEVLLEKLNSLGVQDIQFNGGIYLIRFSIDKNINDLLKILVEENIKIKYLRDISNSTRRLF
jgi:ABC-2 type transport system ATP-binding protein